VKLVSQSAFWNRSEEFFWTNRGHS